jgi:hypothetical protein
MAEIMAAKLAGLTVEAMEFLMVLKKVVERDTLMEFQMESSKEL